MLLRSNTEVFREQTRLCLPEMTLARLHLADVPGAVGDMLAERRLREPPLSALVSQPTAERLGYFHVAVVAEDRAM
jgi:hypothetical protein